MVKRKLRVYFSFFNKVFQQPVNSLFIPSKTNNRSENLNFEHNVLTSFIENNTPPEKEKLLFVCSITPSIEEMQNNRSVLEVTKNNKI